VNARHINTRQFNHLTEYCLDQRHVMHTLIFLRTGGLAVEPHIELRLPVKVGIWQGLWNNEGDVFLLGKGVKA